MTTSNSIYLNDADNFKVIMEAANIMELPKDEQKELIDIVASVLHFGNVLFGVDEHSKTVVIENKNLQAISSVSFIKTLDYFFYKFFILDFRNSNR